MAAREVDAEEDDTKTIQIIGVLLLLFFILSAVVTFESSSNLIATLPFTLLIYGPLSAVYLLEYRSRWKRLTISARGIEFQASTGRHASVSWDEFDQILLKAYGSHWGVYFGQSDNFLDIKFCHSEREEVVCRMKMRFWDKDKAEKIIRGIRENARTTKKQIEERTKHLRS